MRTERSLRCIIFVLSFAGATSTALGQDLVELATPECNHSQDVETAIAVNPLNPCDAVAVWFSSGNSPECPEDLDHEGWYATTRDGGDTVYIAQFIPTTTSHRDPSVVYDPYTEVFWAAHNAREGNHTNVLYAKSSIDSATNNIVFDADNQVTLVDGGFTDKPWIAVGRRPGHLGASNLYLAYKHSSTIRFRRSVSDSCSEPDPNGRCWEPSQNLGIEGQSAIPHVSPTSPEIIYMPYEAIDTDPDDTRIEIVKSIDTGASFGNPLVVADLDDNANLRLCVAGRGASNAKFPAIAARVVNPLVERVFLVWADGNLGNSECSATCGTGTTADVDIYFARLKSSTKNGTIAVEPGFPKVIVADPALGGYTCADQWVPSITIDGKNTLHVVYFDNRLTPDAADPIECPVGPNQRHDDSCAATFDLFHTFSTDDGDTWSTPQRITDVSTFIQRPTQGYFTGDYIGVAADLNPVQTPMGTAVINAAFNRDLDPGGDFLAQEVWVGRIEPANCAEP